MSKKSRKELAQEEEMQRIKATVKMVDAIPSLGALSISLSDGNYERAYDACESIIRTIYDIQLRCACMTRIYK